MGCFTTLIFVAGAVFMMVSLLRWFEQITDAVDHGQWRMVSMLLSFPLATWFYESRVAAGRPTPVPHHEPVRGFGKVSLQTPEKVDPGPKEAVAPPRRVEQQEAQPPAFEAQLPPLAQRLDDGPPPGTPSEFLGMPTIPPKKKKTPIDPEKLEKMRQKMREQGMLPPES